MGCIMEGAPAIDVLVIDVYASRYQQFTQFEVPIFCSEVETYLVIFSSSFLGSAPAASNILAISMSLLPVAAKL